MPVDAPWRWVPVPSSELEELCQSNSTGPSLETGAPPNELRTCAVKCAGPNLPIGDDASTLSTDTPEKQRARIAGPSLQTSALPLGYGANYLLRLELKWGLTVTEGSDFGKGQRRAIGRWSSVIRTITITALFHPARHWWRRHARRLGSDSLGRNRGRDFGARRIARRILENAIEIADLHRMLLHHGRQGSGELIDFPRSDTT